MQKRGLNKLTRKGCLLQHKVKEMRRGIMSLEMQLLYVCMDLATSRSEAQKLVELTNYKISSESQGHG